MLLVRSSTANRMGTRVLSPSMAPVRTAGWPAATCCANRVSSILTMVLASPLTRVKTLILASATGSPSNSLIKAAISGMLSAEAVTTKALARASAVICTSVKIPDFITWSWPSGPTVINWSRIDLCSKSSAIPGAMAPGRSAAR